MVQTCSNITGIDHDHDLDFCWMFERALHGISHQLSQENATKLTCQMVSLDHLGLRDWHCVSIIFQLIFSHSLKETAFAQKKVGATKVNIGSYNMNGFRRDVFRVLGDAHHGLMGHICWSVCVIKSIGWPPQRPRSECAPGRAPRVPKRVTTKTSKTIHVSAYVSFGVGWGGGGAITLMST